MVCFRGVGMLLTYIAKWMYMYDPSPDAERGGLTKSCCIWRRICCYTGVQYTSVWEHKSFEFGSDNIQV